MLSKTNAYAEGSVLDSAGDVSLDALSSSGIASVVVAASAAVAVGVGGLGASIGAAIAENVIGYTAGGTRQPAQVQAYLKDSSVDAEGDVVLTATSAQHINAGTGAGSAAIAGGGIARRGERFRRERDQPHRDRREGLRRWFGRQTASSATTSC